MTQPNRSTDSHDDDSEPTTHGDAEAISIDSIISSELLDRIAAIEMTEMPDLDPVDDSNHASQNKSNEVTEHLEEIAEDMLNLMQRMNHVEQSLAGVLSVVEQTRDTTSQSTRTIAREIDILRREMVGDRKHNAATDLFNELIPLIDRLCIMRQHLDGDVDARMRDQLDGVIETLQACLRRLGCEAFFAEITSDFDPNRMQCEAFADDGEPGVVVETLRPGYLFGDFVLRPASVKVGATQIAAINDSGDGSDE